MVSFLVQNSSPAQREEILELFQAASDIDPTYIPQVSGAETTVAEWFGSKKMFWSKIAVDEDKKIVGHMGVRPNKKFPSGKFLPNGCEWELGRLAVHPDRRREGVAEKLVQRAERSFGDKLWAACQVDSPSHRLFLKRGWKEFAEVSWRDDPAPGVALQSPFNIF